MKKSIYILVSAICFSSFLLFGSQDVGVEFSYKLNHDAFVTIVVEKEDGTRVRNLVSCAERNKGENSEYWDGLDDSGDPCLVGKYRWRGIEHEDIGSYFKTAFYSPGNPPWNTQDVSGSWNIRAAGAGGWLSDHGAPQCLYASDGKVFVGCRIAEAGHSLMELDESGNKKWGTLWFSASCANAVAVDSNIIYVAGEKGWIGNKLKIHRLSTDTYRFIQNPKGWHNVKRTDAAFVDEVSTNFSGICGMVITDEYIILSLSDNNRLALFDKQTADFVRDISVPAIGGIFKKEDGGIFAVSGQTIVKIDLATGKIATIVSSNLEQPAQLAIDSSGNFYVSDAAKSEQCVKKFSTNGKFIQIIGEKGGRHEGLYNSKTMGNPYGLAIDSSNNLWVAEDYFFPKRLSVWSSDGELIKEFLGGPAYGGGGSLDPHNSNAAFYNGMFFEINPWPKQATLKAIIFLPEKHTDLPINYKSIPSYAIRQNGSLYLCSAAGYNLPSVVYELKENHLQPRAALGSIRELKKHWEETQKLFVDKLSADKVEDHVPFLWSDLNGDGKAEPSEISLLKDCGLVKPIWSSRTGEQLQLQAIIRKDKVLEVIRMSPKHKNGKLVYSFDDFVKTPLDKGACALASDPAGNYIANYGGGGNQGDKYNMLAGLNEAGDTLWTYPNPYPANWHNSPRPTVGNIQHTLNVEGFAEVKGFDTPLFQLNGNKGVRYLFTTDGLFVCQLFGDMRTTPLISQARTVEVGTRLDKYSLIDECFGGWLGNSSNGDVLQILGKESCDVLEVKGLNTLKRIKGANIRLHKVADVLKDNDEKPNIKMIFNPVFGVRTHEYKYVFPTENPIVKFAVSYTLGHLTFQMTVNDESPFKNGGQDFKTLFKTGDCIDIRLSSNNMLPKNRTKPGVGDMRIIVADMNGKPTAVLYKFVITGTDDGERSKFISPVGTCVVDEIKVLDKVGIKIDKKQKSYSAKISIPWKELGFLETQMDVLKGDVGVIMSDSEGTRNVARYYYYDQKSQVVSDLPSEASVDPSQWGTFEL